MQLSQKQILEFRETVWGYYQKHARSMPWRETPTPYYVMVSELMLQQTQVERVRLKFMTFIEEFPDIATLAAAPLSDVLTAWSGLGYNRRAKFLWQAAQMIMKDFHGSMPQSVEALQRLPGIGSNTAGAIVAYAFNQPAVFIETNVRTVLFHHFFADTVEPVSDRQLHTIAQQVLEKEEPRQWYWAVMDYGTHLKKQGGGRLQQSKHYKKQSPLKGSIREVRGQIIRLLTTQSYTESMLRQAVQADERFAPALAALVAEGLVQNENTILRLTDR